jgi:acetyltransferase-like isoleucine patch superfamily enzyme
MDQSTSSDWRREERNLLPLRQPISKTLREIVTRKWMQVMLLFSPISPLFIYLAGLPLGPYKDKRQLLHRRELARYIGDRSYISPRAQIHCPEFQMGPRCFIDDYVTIYAHAGAQGGVYLEENVHIYRWSIVELGKGNGSLRVGSNTYIQSGCTLNAFVSNIAIGTNCMIAHRCAFMPYQHGFADTTRPMREQSLTSRGDIVIEDDVWLGVNVSVMDGVTIGHGAVVGAGAMVTEDIPPYAIAAGVPARTIRFRGTGETQDVSEKHDAR